MQVAIYQGPQTVSSVDTHMQIMTAQAGEAAAEGTDLLIFPEMFLTGYNIGPERTRELAQPADGEAAARAGAIARDNDISLLFGFPELADGRVYNSAILVDRKGELRLVYRKTHLFSDIDRSAFSAGDAPCDIIELDGLKMGILICYDVEFGENMRALALAGADFVAVPTALMRPYRFIPEKMVPTRAFENQVFVAYANRCDVEGELDYYGLSCIVAPNGDDLARAGAGEERITARFDFKAQEESRRYNTYFTDRRPELYQALTAVKDSG